MKVLFRKMPGWHGGGCREKSEIVVGLDDSSSGKAALGWAGEQARTLGAVLRAVHVLDWPYGLSSAGFPAPANFMDVSREEIEESYRQAITAMFEAISPPSDWMLQFTSGDTGRVLVQQSADARLLVVGTREHVGLGRLLNGSVSHYCLSHAACPVVAVPAPLSDRSAEHSDMVEAAAIAEADQDATPAIQIAEQMADELDTERATLVVADVDASVEGLAAAHYAVMAAGLRGAEVVLVHAFPPSSARTSNREDTLSAARAGAEKLLGAVAAQLIIPPELQLSTRVEPWDPVAVLEESAHGAAMLVLGRDHVSWGERLFMGAVTSQIVSLIPCPLVVVPGVWRARHAVPRLPDIAVSTAVVSGDADAQLVRWSRSAGVVVVGHPRRRGWGSWTRSVARSVMRRTHCLLIVAPKTTAQGVRDRMLADHALT